MMVEPTLVGLVAGFVYSLIGWIRKQPTTPEPFNYKRLGATVVAGAIAGWIAGIGNIPLDNAMEIVVLAFASIGATEVTAAKTIKAVTQ